MKNYSFKEVDAILCVWDCIACPPDGVNIGGREAMEQHGAAAMREACAALGVYVEQVFLLGKAHDPDCWDKWVFDWEVVPAIMKQIKWEPSDASEVYTLPPDPLACLRTALTELCTKPETGR